jgi:hypothetical protein
MIVADARIIAALPAGRLGNGSATAEDRRRSGEEKSGGLAGKIFTEKVGNCLPACAAVVPEIAPLKFCFFMIAFFWTANV